MILMKLRTIARLALLGMGVCTASVSANAGPVIAPRKPAPAPAVTAGGPAEVTDVQVSGFKTAGAGGSFTVLGHGMCRLRIASYTAPYVHATSNPIELQFYDVAVQLPHTFEMKKPAAAQGGDHIAEIYSLGAAWGGLPGDDDKKSHPGYAGCVVAGPASAGNFRLQKIFSTFTPPSVPNGKSATMAPAISVPGIKISGRGTPNTTSPGSNNPSSAPESPTKQPPAQEATDKPLPATGNITNLQVPGGSFAVDETQRLQIYGKGGCGFDLAIHSTEQGVTYKKQSAVGPLGLDRKPMLYNTTHFDTLPVGSYSATATGTNGCTGTATIDFKVTPKVTIKYISGKPSLSIEKGPISGASFKKADSNINFVVTVPGAIKSEPNAGCCEVEYNFKNEYGGWEVLPNSPYTDASFGESITGSKSIAYKSVSGFTEGVKWRMKVRAYKYHTAFDWSDWLEFQAEQK